MKAKKTITICASVSHYPQVLKVENDLKKLGFKVKVPRIAHVMQKTGIYAVEHYKTWYKDAKDYSKKTALMQEHFKKVIASDAVLIVNFEKNGIKGYIGGNTLMEITLAFYLKKPIYILNPISEDLSIKEEIYGINPVFINGDLGQINH